MRNAVRALAGGAISAWPASKRLGRGLLFFNCAGALIALALVLVAGTELRDLRAESAMSREATNDLHRTLSGLSYALVDLEYIETQVARFDRASPAREPVWQMWVDQSREVGAILARLQTHDLYDQAAESIDRLAEAVDDLVQDNSRRLNGLDLAEADHAETSQVEPNLRRELRGAIAEAADTAGNVEAEAVAELDRLAVAAIAKIAGLGALSIGLVVLGSVLFVRLNNRTEEALERIRLLDPLTRLLNREGFRARGNRAREKRGRTAQEAMIILDIDYFQIINETAGHEHGDRLLTQLGALLSDVLRHEDVLGRIGSNEFAALVHRNTQDEIMALTQTMRSRIRSMRFVAAGERCHITATAGVAMVSMPEIEFGDIFATCEAALLLAKSGARDSEVVLATGQSDNEIRRNMHRANQLPAIIASNGLRLAFQEIPSLSSSHKRCELLLRACDPETGDFISPAEIIGPAERFGLINEIDRWVFRNALDAMASGVLDDYEKIGINLSAVSIDDGFAQFIVEHLRANPLHAKRISFEITETAVIGDLESARRFMYTVRDLGASFAIDDFGVGTASFGLLRALPFETMKIDGQFVSGLEHDAADAEVIRSFVNVANALGITTVAERAETDLQVVRLRELNVDYVQGYAVHRPAMLDTLVPYRVPAIGSMGSS